MNGSAWKRTGWCGIGIGGVLLLILCGYLLGEGGDFITPWTLLGTAVGVASAAVGVVVVFGCWWLDESRRQNAELRDHTTAVLTHVADALTEQLPPERGTLARRRIGDTG